MSVQPSGGGGGHHSGLDQDDAAETAATPSRRRADNATDGSFPFCLRRWEQQASTKLNLIHQFVSTSTKHLCLEHTTPLPPHLQACRLKELNSTRSSGSPCHDSTHEQSRKPKDDSQVRPPPDAPGNDPIRQPRTGQRCGLRLLAFFLLLGSGPLPLPESRGNA